MMEHWRFHRKRERERGRTEIIRTYRRQERDEPRHGPFEFGPRRGVVVQFQPVRVGDVAHGAGHEDLSRRCEGVEALCVKGTTTQSARCPSFSMLREGTR